MAVFVQLSEHTQPTDKPSNQPVGTFTSLAGIYSAVNHVSQTVSVPLSQLKDQSSNPQGSTMWEHS